MTFDYLREHHLELLHELEVIGYGKKYRQTFEAVIQNILGNAECSGWRSFYDVYDFYCAKGLSKSRLKVYAAIIGSLKNFDEQHTFPVLGKRVSITRRDKFDDLPCEFKGLLNYYIETHQSLGNSTNTIHNVYKIGRVFLYSMQVKGCQRISEITEEDVLSYFSGADDGIHRGYGTAELVRRLFKCGMGWKHDDCKTVLAYLPKFPRARKILPYLDNEEIAKIRSFIDDPNSGISLRDRAICLTLIFTGLRRGDIAAMCLDDIDWANSRISIEQEKTGQMVTILMVPVLGNAIYDYIREERGDCNYPQVFLSRRYAGKPMLISGAAINQIIKKVSEKAGIRQGERIFPHLFRHRMATTMLENGVAQPIISNTLGHSSPSSVEQYLSADFIHLKECALSIEAYPVSEEVFG